MRIYGIDLGTTNSAVALDGELITNLVPSIADLQTKKAGETLRKDFSAERSFKINISQGDEGRISREATALIFAELINLCKEKGHDLKDAVISVPAYFTSNQRLATKEAAESVGIKVHATANEPTVAAMEYSRDSNTLAVVFDLGGGTFDISVIDSRMATYDVLATDGIVVGGDNFDTELSRAVIKGCGVKLHKLGSEDVTRLKWVCSEAKLNLQKSGETQNIVLDFLTEKQTAQSSFPLTMDTYLSIMKSTFNKCLVTTKRVIEKSIDSFEDYELLFVGGSTRCPYLRAWIEQELDHKQREQTYNPDTVVALGAAHYASLIENGELEYMVSDVTKAIGIRKVDGTIARIIHAGSKLPAEETAMLTNPEACKGLNLDVYQGDSLMSDSNQFLGTLRYEFGEYREAMTSNVKVTLTVDISGILKVKAEELFKESQEITLCI